MDNDLVQVMVPKKHLSRVYRLLADLDQVEAADVRPAPRADAAAADDRGDGEDWTPQRVKRMVDESPPAMRSILRVLAENAGEWLNSQQLAEAIEHKPDADWNTVAGTFGAFARRISNRYGLGWPFDNIHDHEVGARRYRMDGAMAREVLRHL